jgi:nitroimidazol reductase NimA-like FMN-containing flavoprotein (pyridoxamine 5'-phosphate oxidase superfamily)
MAEDSRTEMGPDEVDDFLGAGGTGVLSLSTGEDAPHSVPVSYGYDATDRVFHFRLSAGPDSAKGDLIDRAVTFVAFDEADDGWQSVVAQGRLEDLEEGDVDNERLAELRRVEIPLVDLFDEPLREVSFEFVRLDPDRLTGRREVRVGE